MKAVVVCLSFLLVCVAGIPVSKKNGPPKASIIKPVPFRGLKPIQVPAPHVMPPKEPKKPETDLKPRPEPEMPVKEPRPARKGTFEVAEAAFAASVSSDQLGSGDADNWANLNFDDIRTERPTGVYTGGIFTAHITGFFAFNVGCNSATYRHIGIRLMIGETAVAYAFDNYADYSSGSASLSYVAFLTRDATVQVQWNNRNSHGIRGGGYCIFSGFYIGSDA